MRRQSLLSFTLLGAAVVSNAACGEEKSSAFQLKFAAVAGSQSVTCTNRIAGFGGDGLTNIGMSDLRFYVSNLQFFDSKGKVVSHELDVNEFQLTAPAGQVGLIDLTGTDAGTCAPGTLEFYEGTARTNAIISGKTRVHDVRKVTFDVGVPQPLMQATIKNYSEETAPSPLDEMYWDWNSGYRHFVFNFAVTDGTGKQGDGHLHIGSRNCGPDGGLALSDRAVCQYIDTPEVEMDSFDLTKHTVAVDLQRALTGTNFVAPLYDPNTYAVIGQGTGVECHSEPDQGNCIEIFPRFGLDIATGAATAGDNAVFYRQ